MRDDSRRSNRINFPEKFSRAIRPPHSSLCEGPQICADSQKARPAVAGNTSNDWPERNEKCRGS